MSTVFWRKEPLNEREKALLDAVLAAHYQSTFRDNPSSLCLRMAACGNGCDYWRSMAAALLAFGGHHGPLIETREMYESAKPVIEFIRSGLKVPGFGNSFVRGQADPLWDTVDRLLASGWTDLHRMIAQRMEALHARGKMIWPNPSTYTALSAMALRIPREVTPWLLVAGRLDAWSRLLLKEEPK